MPNLFTRVRNQLAASRANRRGRILEKQGCTDAAIGEYECACALDPEWAVPFYNLGLIHKYSGAWELSLSRNQRAVELDAGNEAAWWNLGIAATALGRWEVARSAWRGFGMDVPDGTGPISFPCGPTPIRLNPETGGEVVWAERLDPARASIRNIPLPESGFRCGDIVLNDGAANGHRILNGSELPVFNCLCLLHASSLCTWVAEVQPTALQDDGGPSSIDILIDMADGRGLAAEDWSTSLIPICKACSDGCPHSIHGHEAEEIRGIHKIAIAAPDAVQVQTLLDDWLACSNVSRVVSLNLVLYKDKVQQVMDVNRP